MLIKKRIKNNKLQEYNINLSSNLRKQNKSNDLFEAMIANLTLEEVIALKLELTYRNLDRPIYGFRLFRYIHYVIKDALLKFVLSVSPSITEARKFIGMDKKDFRVLLQKYETREYLFPEEKENANNRSTAEENI